MVGGKCAFLCFRLELSLIELSLRHMADAEQVEEQPVKRCAAHFGFFLLWLIFWGISQGPPNRRFRRQVSLT